MRCIKSMELNIHTKKEMSKMRKELTAREKYELLSGGEPTILTEEGSIELWKLLAKPNPQRDKTMRQSKNILTDQQRKDFGKKRVYLKIKLKRRDI